MLIFTGLRHRMHSQPVLSAKAVAGYSFIRSLRSIAGLSVCLLWPASALLAQKATATPVNAGSTAAYAPTGGTVTFHFTASTTLNSSLATAIQVVTQGNPNLDFTYASGGSCAQGASYSNNGSCTVNFMFAPMGLGLRSGAVTLYDNTGTLVATGLIYGAGTGPQIGITPGTISTYAGSGNTQSFGNGGQATSAGFSVGELAIDAVGNIYIADEGSESIRKITASTGVISTIATFSVQYGSVEGLAVDGAGNVYAGVNAYLYKVAANTNTQTLIAGDGNNCYNGTGIAATSAETCPYGLFVNGNGDIYIASFSANRVQMISQSTGLMNLVAGTGTASFSGDNGPATSATLYEPTDVTVDLNGNVYIADQANNRIRKITSGTISTVAGNGGAGYGGEGGVATSTSLYNPSEVRTDAAGDIYFFEAGAGRIRKVTHSTSIINTVAGDGTNAYNASQDGGPATSAGFYSGARGLVIDNTGNLYIADSGRIRKVTASGNAAFASTAVTATSSDSPKALTVANNGTDTLTFPIPGTGTNPSISTGFTIGNSSTCPQLTTSSGSNGSLSAGATCTYLISFQPTVSGANSGQLVTTDNTTTYVNQSQTSILTGTGTTGSTAQTITFPQPASPATASTSAMLQGTSSSGLNVTYTITSGPATVSGSNVTYTGPGTVVIAANQAGNATYAPATAVSRTVTVLVAPTVASVTAVSSVFGSTTGITVTATESGSNGAVTGGVVTFTTGGSATGSFTPTTCTLPVGGSCSVSYTPTGTLAGGTYAGAIIANFAAVGSYSAASGSNTLTITPASKTITFPQPSSPVCVGATATLAATASGGDPVTYTITSGMASISGSMVTFTNAGTVTITANSAASTNYSAAAAVSQSVTVNKGTPTPLATTPTGITYGTSSEPLSGTLAYGGSAPTGSVTFSVDGGTANSATCIGSSSPLTCSTTYSSSALSVGNHNIVMMFNGDSNYNAINASQVTLVVSKATPTVAASAGAVSYGATTATLTATIPYSGAVPPSGGVTFSVDGGSGVSSTCTAASNVQTCSASYNISTLSVGNHNLSATLASDSNYIGSQSATVLLTINKATPALTASGQNVSYGTSTDTLSATLTYTGSGAAPAGAVSFSVNGGPFVTGTCMGSTSPITCTLPYAAGTLAPGSYNLAAMFAGDSNYATVTSSTTTFNVTTQVPTVTVSAPSISYGTATDTLTAMVAYTGAGLTPAGAVTFTVNGGSALTATCSGTTSPRTCTYSYASGSLAAGSYPITAAEAADSNYAAASATPGTLVVSAGTDTVTLSSTAGGMGDTVTLTATLSGVSNGFSGGTMTFTANSTTICAAVMVSNGMATCTSPPLTTGTNNFTVAFSGSGNYAGSNDTSTPLVITVDPPSDTGTGSTPPGGTSAPIAETISFGSAFTLGSIGVTNYGAAGNAFTIVSGGTCPTTAGASYTASTSCTVYVTFSNVAPGLLTGSIIFTDQNGNTVTSIPVATLGVR
jgi:hypothetical protein